MLSTVFSKRATIPFFLTGTRIKVWSIPKYVSVLLGENRAVLLEESSVVFKFLEHLHSINPEEVSKVVDEILDDMDSLRPNLFYIATIDVLVASNRLKTRSVESLVLLRLVERVQAVWKRVLSEEDRQEIRNYALSEKPIVYVKNNLTAAQVSRILDLVSQNTFPLKTRIPSLLILSMETVASTSKFAEWVSDSSSKLIESNPTSWGNAFSDLWSEKSPPPFHGKTHKRKTVPEPKSTPSLTNTPNSEKIGIDMSPLPCSRTNKRRIGVHIGPPPKPKERIAFKVHGESHWNRLREFFSAKNRWFAF